MKDIDPKKLEKDLQKSKGDLIHTASKTSIEFIPTIGGPLAELFNAVITPPIEKRRDKCILIMAEAINELQKRKDFDIESLYENEIFITTLMHASTIAIRNHQKEKLEALRNAVLNSALHNSPGEDMELIFLNTIDRITTWHLIVLYYLNNPQGNIPGRIKPRKNIEFLPKIETTAEGKSVATTNLKKLIFDVFPEIKNQTGLCGQIFIDLNTMGLINTENNGIYTTNYDNSLISSCVTQMGKNLIDYISEPPIQHKLKEN